MNPRLYQLPLLLMAAMSPFAARAASIDFARDIRPILSDNCYQCHGPDEQARKASLRLDTRDGAFRLKDGKAVIVAGHSDQSDLVRRIFSTDPDELMPKSKSNHKLSAVQKDLLKRWVDEGASWSLHWAFVPPARQDAPAVKNAVWAINPIDRFVLANLEGQGLKPSPQAEKHALIRRVSLDLTGLPPTIEEVDAFVRDERPDAYERLIDRLLVSPRYGERMAADWLDIARFADTHGYQMDRYRAMWPYRDWVIKAFNENLPFNQFITWQLAGDLLPHPTKEQRLATAFNRLHLQNEEGGIVEEEYRVSYVVDRVTTFGTAFLGLTFECSRCHDHKFDPITQKDFYSLFAFFQNIDESGQTTYFTDSMPVPTLLLSTDQQDAKLAELKIQIAQKQKQLSDIAADAEPRFAEWLEHRPESVRIAGEVGSFDFESIDKGKIANAADSAKPGRAIENPKIFPGKSGNGALLSGDNGFTFPGVGHFTRSDPFAFSILVNVPAMLPRMVLAHHSKAPIDAGSRGYELLLEDGHVAFGLHHMWPGNSLKVATKQTLPANQWVHIAVTYDGSSRTAGVHLYIDGQLAPTDIIRDGLSKDITYERGGEPDLAVGYRFRDSGFKDGKIDDFHIFNRALSALEIAQQAERDDLSAALTTETKSLTASQRGELFDFYLANFDEPARALTDELHALRKQQSGLVNPIPEVMVMQELPQPKPAYILRRGAYDAHGEQVVANTPAVLPAFAADQPRNRLGLARWLLSAENPLPARVIVNRAWQQMFGRGIVETSDNFGSQGSPPTDPQLLDWLAVEFAQPANAADQPWDMKRLLKLIAMSATYRQSSVASADLLARDPANQWLARGPSRRLTAEMLRDQALFDSGLLAEMLGGPSVFPYQPDGFWDVAMGKPKYEQSHGGDLHRRSLYTFWKRTIPPPAMVTFDAAERSICTVRRQSTSTPLQALALLNDPQITEAARFISQRMLKEGGATLEERVSWAFKLVTNRSPAPAEMQILVQMFVEQRELFGRDSASAKKLLAVGEARNDPSLDEADLAAGTVLAEAILNHDEAVMRR
ncbi:MAG TPA: DUF1553 domain-containing protein [Humisphaera sp.]|jgi:hypothetical protein|nr:DUF1553 domain-containing protein [Humisphaera sp.]